MDQLLNSDANFTTQLLDLDARASRGAVDPELTAQVRVLSRDLARAGDALAEVERMIALPGSERVPTPT